MKDVEMNNGNVTSYLQAQGFIVLVVAAIASATASGHCDVTCAADPVAAAVAAVAATALQLCELAYSGPRLHKRWCHMLAQQLQSLAAAVLVERCPAC
jgi:hypothetical protein